MLLPNVIISMWSRVSPRVPAHVCPPGLALRTWPLGLSHPPLSARGLLGSCSSLIAS